MIVKNVIYQDFCLDHKYLLLSLLYAKYSIYFSKEDTLKFHLAMHSALKSKTHNSFYIRSTYCSF